MTSYASDPDPTVAPKPGENVIPLPVTTICTGSWDADDVQHVTPVEPQDEVDAILTNVGSLLEKRGWDEDAISVALQALEGKLNEELPEDEDESEEPQRVDPALFARRNKK